MIMLTFSLTKKLQVKGVTVQSHLSMSLYSLKTYILITVSTKQDTLVDCGETMAHISSRVGRFSNCG